MTSVKSSLFSRTLKYKSHFKSGIFYTGSSLFTTLVNIIAGFLVLRWVGPEEMGLWQLLLIINSYALLGNLGITSGLARELPYLLGKGEKLKALDLAATTKAYTMFCSVVSVIIMVVGSLYFYFAGKTTAFIFSFATIMSILSINFFKDYLLTLFRTNKAFKRLSISYLILGFTYLLLIPLIYYYHYYGYLIYNIATTLISLLLLLIVNPIKVGSKFETKNFVILLKTGIPLFLMAYLFGISKTFLKFSILHYGGVALLGLFAPVFAIRNGINTLPKAISQYLYPKFSYKIGATGNPDVLWKPVKNISFLLLISLSLIILPVYYYMPELLTFFFPKYIESIFPCRMALFSGVIFGSFIGVFALNSVKGYKERFIISVSYIILSAAIPFILPIFFHDKTLGLAWAILSIDFVYFFIAYFVTRAKLKNG